MLDTSDLPVILTRLEEFADRDKYNLAGKPYPISTVYFDSNNNDLARQSEAKPFFKSKLRVRSYTVPTDFDNVFIEMKQKINGVGIKRRAMMKYSDARRYIETGEKSALLSSLDRQVLSEIDYFRSVYHPTPKVYVCYERYAFTGRDDSRLRITLDSSILVRRDRLRLSDGYGGEPLLPDGKVLMEIKIPDTVPIWLARLMSDYSLSFGSFSKYGNAYKNHVMKTSTRMSVIEYN